MAKLSLESLIEDQEGVDVVDVAAELETDTELDISGVDEITQVGEDTVDTQADLQDTAAIVERSDELNEPALEMLGKILEMASKRTGFKSKAVSMESNSSMTKQMALESIADHLKKIALAIIAFIRKAWLKVKEFFAQFFDRVKKVKKMAEALKARAEKAKGVSDKEIKQGSFTKNVLVLGKLTDSDTVAQTFLSHVSTFDEFFKSHFGEANFKKNCDTLLGAAKTAETGKTTNVEFSDFIPPIPVSSTDKMPKGYIKVGQDTGELILPLGKDSIWVYGSTDWLKMSKIWSRAFARRDGVEPETASVTRPYKIWLEKSSKYVEPSEKEMHSVMSADNVKKVSEAVSKHLDVFTLFEKVMGEAKRFEIDLEKVFHASKMRTNENSIAAKDGDLDKFYGDLSRGATLLMNAYINFGMNLRNHDLNVCAGVIELAHHSLGDTVSATSPDGNKSGGSLAYKEDVIKVKDSDVEVV